MRSRLAGLALLSCLVLTPGRAGEPDKDLKSKELKVRLAAVAALRKDGGTKAESLLIGALRDRDWEVVENAVIALGERGGRKAAEAMVKTALAGPTIRIRYAAARSLAKLDAGFGAREISKRVAGDWAQPACEALGILARSYRGEEIEQGLKRGLGEKEVRVRVAAARAIAGLRSGRRRILEQVLELPEASVRAAALDAMRASPDPADAAMLLEQLNRDDLPDVLSRRVLAALRAIVGTAFPGTESADTLGKRVLFGHELARDPEVAARFARLAGQIAAAPPPPGKEDLLPQPRAVSPKVVEPVLKSALAHASEEVRATAVHALGRVGTKACLDLAADRARSDESARVRFHALRAVAGTRGMKDEATFDLVCDRLANDADPLVREEAAVRLGVRELPGAARALAAALADRSWEVAICAAVSLGKTGDAAAVEPLLELAKSHDWRRRGAAIVACGHLRDKRVVPSVISALAAKEDAVSRSAYEVLLRMSTKRLPPQPKPWMAWWREVEKSYEFVDRDKLARDAKKHGYATTYVGVYENLDVIVLQSRGDTIQDLLGRLGIAHRLTRSGQVASAGVHPWAVFVANCTGEIVDKDVEQLRWFVRTGGYLFCSCWALTYTLVPVCGGACGRLPQTAEILDNVIAEKCPSTSPYLEGVFEGKNGGELTRPVYVLYGAHLIEVLDPERVEVLIDSPDCADRWGEGNLAAWFTAGHGVILDSANHFDLQGLERVTGLKSAEDRMAYAMDHLGLSYADVRELARKRVWNSQSKAAAEARDLSAFRFITNFVRQKRRVDR